MQSQRILVASTKGGCGKTTVATNLCAAYAAQGLTVGLVDNDSQGSGTYWAAQRPADAPPVELAASGKPAADRVVIDGLGCNSEQETDELVAIADVILLPILPSAIDIRAGERFITALMTRPQFRAAPLPVGVIANRVQPNTPAQARLMHFLSCLNVPVAVTLRDSPLYGDAMGSGLGVADLLDVRAARKERAAWRMLIHWVEEQLPSGGKKPRPLAAGRPSDGARRSMPERVGLLPSSPGAAAAREPKRPQLSRLSA